MYIPVTVNSCQVIVLHAPLSMIDQMRVKLLKDLEGLSLIMDNAGISEFTSSCTNVKATTGYTCTHCNLVA